ncbi:MULTISPECIES: ABC transporter substrate-binding protein [unclassified Leucobacter]|uniref:ABC transporter substrate-binding protein n=1 Tax=unclassified Leucobacter TaxID=2621730 RepID=UPI00165E593E|nr:MULTISPECIES: peptide ABC transporter substrate-binding protein [unclassified Leucobacter]MBC9928363.1 peptide ABC transporter substrate-binding protein [Leucobacter sp. cx-169]
MKTVKALVGMAAALAIIAAPLSAAQAADEPTESSLRLSSSMDEIDTLNPFTAVFNEALIVLDYEYQPLAGINETGDYGGILADDFSVDNTTWTYHIRDKATWSDGEPVTADDVVWTYEAVMGSKPLQVANGESVGNISSVTAVDDKTVEIETTAPTPLHPGILPIVPKHIWEKIDNPEEYPNTEDVVGSGPFIIEEYKQGTSITLKSNEHYWNGPTGVDKLHIVGFKNTDAAVLALRNGEIDMLGGLNSAQFDSLASVDGIEPYQVESKHFFNLTLNGGWKTTGGEAYGTQNPVLEDQAFRRAIGQAIDRKVLVDKVINGLGSEGPTILPPGSPGGFFTELEGVALPQGVEEAKKSLEAAGYTTDADGNRLDKNGAPITLRMMFNGGSTSNTAASEFIESWFKDLGIAMELKNTNWDEMGELIPKGDYDTYIDGWGVSQDPDYMLSINVCSTLPDEPGVSSSSQSGMCDPEYDKVFEAQHTELDPEKRKELVTEALTMIYEYGNTAMFYYDDALGAYNSDRLDNLLVVNGSPNNRFSIAQATIKGAEGESGDGGSGVPAVAIGVGIAAVVLAGGLIFAIRRKKSVDDRK